MNLVLAREGRIPRVMAGLLPAIPTAPGRRCPPKRDARHKGMTRRIADFSAVILRCEPREPRRMSGLARSFSPRAGRGFSIVMSLRGLAALSYPVPSLRLGGAASQGRTVEETLQTLLLLLAVMVIVAVVARRINTAPSILLVIAGIVLALIPGVPRITLAPELVLLGILPPLVYSAGVAMS